MDAESKGCKKLSLYIPHELLEEMEAEARRLKRPLSWLMREAWKKARGRIATFPDRPTLPEREEPQQLAAGM
jgi:uncharacterized small protein (TIGR04563 family)